MPAPMFNNILNNALFHSSARINQTRMRCGGFYNDQFSCWVRWWKNFENRPTYGEVMGKRRVSCFFLTHWAVLA